MILSIDTLAPVVGVAAVWGDRVAVRSERVVRGTETRLTRWISEVCEELGGGTQGIEGVAVAVGPGAFTGLRVGLSTAAGLAMALGVPVWPTHGLRSRANRAGNGHVVVLLDARKDRFYAARFFDGSETRAPADLGADLALEGLSPGFVATGEGALLLRSAIEANGGTVLSDADDPAVRELAFLGVAGLAAGQGCDPREVAPLYLREPDAIRTADRRVGWT